MIHITQNQKITESENLRVASPTGDYEDAALIEFYDINQPDVVSGAFQAQFVMYGSLVYRYSDHVELGNAILAIDPESTHASASYVRMSQDLFKQISSGTLEPSSLDQVVTDEQQKNEEKINETENVEQEIVSTPEVVEGALVVPEAQQVGVDVLPVENIQLDVVESIITPTKENILEKTTNTMTKPLSILRRTSKRKIT